MKLVLITAAVVGIAYTFRDYIFNTINKLLDNEECPNRNVQTSVKVNNSQSVSPKREETFCLDSISLLFGEYGISPSEFGSFPRLLNKIENFAYVNYLKFILEHKDNCQILVDAISTYQIKPIQLKHVTCSNGTYISTVELDKFLLEQGIIDSNLKEPLDKVRTLVNYYQGKGIEKISNKFGDRIKTLIELHNNNQPNDVSFNDLIKDIEVEYELNT